MWGKAPAAENFGTFNYEIVLFCLQIGSVVRVSDQWGVRWKIDFLAGMKNFRPAAWMTESSDGEGPSSPPYKYYPAEARMQLTIWVLVTLLSSY